MRFSVVTALTGSLIALNAQAGFVYFNYIDSSNNAETTIPLQKYINQANNVNVGLSAGLDRKTELVLSYEDSGLVVHKEMTDYISVNDRVSNPFGSDFYGYEFKLPGLAADTNYTLTQNVYDNKDVLIKTESFNFTVDNTPPVLGDIRSLFYGTQYDPVSWLHEGSRILSYRETTHLEASVNETGSGFLSANYVIHTDNGGDWLQFKSMEVGDTEGKLIFKNSPTYSSTQYGLRSVMPNYSSKVRVDLDVTDKAGNTSTASAEFNWVTCNYDKDTPWSEADSLMDVVGISDPNSNGLTGVANTTGYRDFTVGDVIPTNPATLILRVPIEISRYSDPIKGYTTDAGNYHNPRQPLSVDANYAYYTFNKTMVLPDGTLIGTRKNAAGALCSGYQNIGTNFSADTLPPEITSASVVFDDNKSYIILNGGNSYSNNEINRYIVTKSSQLPTGAYYSGTAGEITGWNKLTGLVVNVKPKPFNQTVAAVYDGFTSSCNIPSGESACTINYNLTMAQLDKLYVHTNHGIKLTQADNGLYSYGTITFKIDMQPPTLVDFNVNENEKFVSGSILNDITYDPYGHLGVATVLVNARNIDTGQIVAITGSFGNSNMRDYIYNVDLDTLQDGRYALKLLAYDSAGNKMEEDIGSIAMDSTPPAISLKHNNQELQNMEVVMGLESLVVELSDLSTSSITAISMKGGPASDNVALDWVSNGDNTYTLEYPRLFPSLEAGESYIMEITAADKYSNTVTTQFNFQYLPANLVTLEAGRLLTTNKLIKRRDDTPIYQIVSSTLRDNNGQLITGTVPVSFTLRSDSEFPVSVYGHTVNAGQTVSWDYSLQENDGKIYLPITPANSGDSGKSNFIFEIIGVTVGG